MKNNVVAMVMPRSIMSSACMHGGVDLMASRVGMLHAIYKRPAMRDLSISTLIINHQQ